jgi:GNAT superfamily N-acetyltransferase
MKAAMACTVRAATPADEPVLLAMAEAFTQGTGYRASIPFVPAYMEALIAKFVDDDFGPAQTGRMAVAEREGAVVGMIAMLAHPHLMTGQLIASEIVWWVNEDARQAGVGRALVADFERFARAQGATAMLMGAWHPELGKTYERYGFRPYEMTFRKALTEVQP